MQGLKSTSGRFGAFFVSSIFFFFCKNSEERDLYTILDLKTKKNFSQFCFFFFFFSFALMQESWDTQTRSHTHTCANSDFSTWLKVSVNLFAYIITHFRTDILFTLSFFSFFFFCLRLFRPSTAFVKIFLTKPLMSFLLDAVRCQFWPSS